MPGAGRCRGQGGYLGLGELTLYVTVCYIGILDACESKGATNVFPGRLDRDLGGLGVDRLRFRRQEIGAASSSILACAFV